MRRRLRRSVNCLCNKAFTTNSIASVSTVALNQRHAMKISAPDFCRDLRAGLAVVLQLRRRPIAADASPWDDDIALGRAVDRRRAQFAKRRDPSCAPASRSSCSRAGRPIGAIRAIPACRRVRFRRSENVKTVTVLWPAPQRFADGSGTSIGYKDDVIFPLRVVPQDAGKPVTLRLKLDYAVCEKLCVPAKARPSLRSPARQARSEAALTAAEARVPKPASSGDARRCRLRGVHATRPRRQAARHRRRRGAAGARSICSPKGRRRLGAAAARAGRRRGRGRAALRLRARRPAARREARGRDAQAHRGRRRQQAIEVAFRLD